MKHVKMVVDYVLAMLWEGRVNELRLKLELLQKLIEKLPAYQIDDILPVITETETKKEEQTEC